MTTGASGRRADGGLDGSGLRVAIVASRFNEAVSSALVDGARSELAGVGVDAADVTEVWVPGAFELPLAAQALAQSGEVDAVVCVGAVIRGETDHYVHVATQCAAGLQRVQLDTGVPVVFGVLTTDTADDALARAGGRHGNKGAESAATAVEMAGLLRRLTKGA